MEKPVTVDVIIPTYKPDKKFYRLIEMLRIQTYPIDRIIIMNTEKKYFPEGDWEEFAQIEIHHIAKAEFDHGGTRNTGAGYSRSDIIVFMTQDAVPGDEYLVERLIAPLKKDYQKKENKAAVSYARQVPETDCNYLESFTRMFNYPKEDKRKTKEDLDKMGIKTFFCSNVCAAYCRDIFLSLGGFSKKTIFNEDMIFAGHAIQAGYAVAYTAKAKVVHSHNYSNIQQFHRNFDLAVSQTDNPDVFAGIRSEGEGIRLVKQTVKYLTDHKKGYLIPSLFLKSGFKYAGFWLGKHYRRLPKFIIRYCTMNQSYWEDL